MFIVYRKIGYLLAGCLFSTSVWAGQLVFPLERFDYVFYNKNTTNRNTYLLDAAKKERFEIVGRIGCGSLTPRAHCGTLELSDPDGTLAAYGLKLSDTCSQYEASCESRGGIVVVDPYALKKTDFVNKEFTVGIKNEAMAKPILAKFVLTYTTPAKLEVSWDEKFKNSNRVLGIYYPSPSEPEYGTLNSTATLTIKNPSAHKIRVQDLEYEVAESRSVASFDTKRLESDIHACNAIFNGGDASVGGECQIHFTFINTREHPQATPAAHHIRLKDFRVADMVYYPVPRIQTYPSVGVEGRDVLSQCPSTSEIQNNWNHLKAHWAIVDERGALTSQYEAIKERMEKGDIFFTGYEVAEHYAPAAKSTDPVFKDSYKNVFVCRYNQTALVNLDEDLFRMRPGMVPGLFSVCRSRLHNPTECWFDVGRGLF